jgi:hypothetical protein
MRKAIGVARITAGAVLLAIAIFVVLAAPGFLSDASSTVPLGSATTEGSR